MIALANSWTQKLTLLGTNHKRAPIEVREKLWCKPETLTTKLSSIIKQAKGIEEVVILSTCNRTEIYSVSSSDHEISTYIERALSEWSGIPSSTIGRYLYVLTGEDAVRHLIAVASGLDSLVVGEPQVQEQVRLASKAASRAGTNGRFLSELFKRADKSADSVRKQSGLETERVSVGSAVAAMLKDLTKEHPIETVLLVGAGKMISLAAEDFSAFPGMQVWVANRTIERGQNLAERFGGHGIPLDDIPKTLSSVDAVLTCTSSADYVVDEMELQKAIVDRDGKELIVVDIAVPRNVNPTANRIPGLKVYNIDDLAPFLEKQEKSYEPKIERAQQLAREQAESFFAYMRSYEATDTLKDLRNMAETIREQELSRALRKLGDISVREKEILDLLTRRIINKLLYEPSIRLKAHASNGDGENYESVVRDLFDMGRRTEE